ncbi:MAG: NYN domain-containing protein [Candidatus Micrarchaeia archaeon]
MPSSVALFIDGSNLYHALKQEGKLPFNYDDLFSELSRTYQIKQIFFYDAVKDIGRDPDGYAKQQKFHAGLKKLGWPIKLRTRKLKYIANITQEDANSAATQVGIVDSCREKLWQFLQRLGLVRVTKEKGVDVLLVSDAIEQARTKQFDAIILLSGDADFVPAINLIRTFGVKTVNLHTYSGSSTELRQACHEHILMDFDNGGVFLR